MQGIAQLQPIAIPRIISKFIQFCSLSTGFRLSMLFVCLILITAESGRADTRDAMVKIYCVQTEPYYYDPWSMNRSISTSGSGCVIAGKRILTNAHVVSDQSFIQVRRHGDPKKYTARTMAVSHAADLALLTVDDHSFFDGIEPLQFGELPQMRQEVLVYGFPEGGDTISITKGVVSRIEHDEYAHSSVSLLAVQIDAAINSGNSGGPVLVNDRISGVVMQVLEESENIGYMVPSPVIAHFLKDLEDGRYDGIPYDGILTQSMENASLKQRYGLLSGRTGVLVVSVRPGAPSEGLVKPGDIVVQIDGHPIADDGTIEFRPNERTSADYYTQQHQIGEFLELDIFRNKKMKKVKFKLTHPVGSGDLVPRERYDVRPTYYIYGGLVFAPLTQNYLMSWGDDWYSSAPKNLVALFRYGIPRVAGEQVVIMSKVLPAEINSGYHDFRDLQIVSVNGDKINRIEDVIRLVEASGKGRFVEFKTDRGASIILERDKVMPATDQILSTYNVPADRSPDLK